MHYKKNFLLLIVAVLLFGCFDPEKVLSISIFTKDATLPDYSNGLAVLKVQGGTAPFVFIWSDIGESDSLRINLSPGEYSVTVIDAIGVKDSLKFNIDSVKGLNILNLEVETTPSSSTGTNDGSARVLVNGGVSPYFYIWSNGLTDSIIYNISPGIYDVTVFDNQGNYGFENFSIQTLNGSFPILTTLPTSNISEYSATSGGNITADGGSSISQKGVCWSTSQNPTIADNSTTNGSGIGNFSSSLTNLTPNTTYYVRAYAFNGNGIAYGNQVSFITNLPPVFLVDSLNCENLSGISSTYYGLNGTSAAWGVNGGGYSGSCWRAPDPNNNGNLSQVMGFDHFVAMNRTFANQGFLEFWLNTYNSGFNNLVPKIYVNGNLIGSALIIGGQLPSSYWLKVRTPTIPTGDNNIKISFDANYYILKVDEIKIFEY